MKKGMNKKGEPMSLGAVVTIIILVIVLVFVVLALSGSFGNLGDYNPFGSGSNVEAVINGCNIACNSGAQDDYCRVIRDVRFEKGADKAKVTCLYMEAQGRKQISGVAIDSAGLTVPNFEGVGRPDIGVCDNINRIVCRDTSLDSMSRPNVNSANVRFNGLPAGQQQAGDPPRNDPVV
tara:strand:- start:70 stop:603 length:534 start_codon:yes stop_codon:yes gene_type:complete